MEHNVNCGATYHTVVLHSSPQLYISMTNETCLPVKVKKTQTISFIYLLTRTFVNWCKYINNVIVRHMFLVSGV